MVQLGTTCGDQLIAHLDWKRDIHQFIAMDMADLAPLAQTVLSPAEPVRMGRDARPARYGLGNSFMRTLNRHTILLSVIPLMVILPSGDDSRGSSSFERIKEQLA